MSDTPSSVPILGASSVPRHHVTVSPGPSGWPWHLSCDCGELEAPLRDDEVVPLIRMHRRSVNVDEDGAATAARAEEGS